MKNKFYKNKNPYLYLDLNISYIYLNISYLILYMHQISVKKKFMIAKVQQIGEVLVTQVQQIGAKVHQIRVPKMHFIGAKVQQIGAK